MERSQDVWFPAKRFGWGWGLPVRWQGWVALAIFVAAVAFAAIAYPPSQNLGAFLAVVLLATFLFGLVCWWKGEAPRWRWGEKNR